MTIFYMMMVKVDPFAIYAAERELAACGRSVPRELLVPSAAKARSDTRIIRLQDTAVYLLDTVASDVSATDVRQRMERGESVRGLVPPRVEEYITKQALYRQALYT